MWQSHRRRRLPTRAWNAASRMGGGGSGSEGIRHHVRDVSKSPISHWLASTFSSPRTGWSSSSHGPRRGGGDVGQVPKDSAGTRRDLEHLTHEARRAAQELYRDIQAAGPRLASFVQVLQPPVFTEASLDRELGMFSLGGVQVSPVDRDVALALLLKPAHLSPDAFKPTQLADRDPERDGPPQCAVLAAMLRKRKVVLHTWNLRTGFADRWLDSVFIDAFLHELWLAYPYREQVYLVSAEADPSLYEIAQTPPCMPICIVPLFLKNHWTIVIIWHKRGVLRYLNSQTVDSQTPLIQTKPFGDAFPGYKIVKHALPRQCDSSSCGVYACFFAMCALFYGEEAMDSVTCPDIDAFRSLILHQLLRSYVLLKRK